MKEGKQVLVVDNKHEEASSNVAAGIINPITGRRFVKSWMIEQLLPAARETFRALEAELNITFFQERNIIRTLFNSREENDWLARSGEEGYTPFMADDVILGNYEGKMEPAFSYGEIRQAAKTDIPLLIKSYRQFLLSKDLLFEAKLDYNAIEIGAEQCIYDTIKARHIIFCEGHQAIHNPYFNYLPFNLAKGEVLIVRIPEGKFEKQLKHRMFICPIKDDLYWVGSNYDWDFEDAKPTEEGKAFLLDRLNDILKVPFEVVTHLGAIRPTVKDRRPFLGVHPMYPRLHIFNGLGTKGASLGPYWAQHFCDFLLNDVPLNADVDINRFAEIYAKSRT